MALNKENEITQNIKIILLGSVKTGKTTFLKKIQGYEVDKDVEYYSTIVGANASFIVELELNNFNLEFWDVSGQEKYYQFIKRFIRNANIIFIFYNSYDISSFDIAKRLVKECKERLNKKVFYVLVRSRYDECLDINDNKNIVSDEEALEYADLNDLYFIHYSNFDKNENSFNELLNIYITNFLN